MHRGPTYEHFQRPLPQISEIDFGDADAETALRVSPLLLRVSLFSASLVLALQRRRESFGSKSQTADFQVTVNRAQPYFSFLFFSFLRLLLMIRQHGKMGAGDDDVEG